MVECGKLGKTLAACSCAWEEAAKIVERQEDSGDGIYTPPPPGDRVSPIFPSISRRIDVYEFPVNSRAPPYTPPSGRRPDGGVYDGAREFTGKSYTPTLPEIQGKPRLAQSPGGGGIDAISVRRPRRRRRRRNRSPRRPRRRYRAHRRPRGRRRPRLQSNANGAFELQEVERVQTRTITIFTEAKINRKWPETASECTSRERIIYDSYAEFNSEYNSCIIRPREVHSEAVSDYFSIYRGLGAYGYGTSLHSPQEASSSASDPDPALPRLRGCFVHCLLGSVARLSGPLTNTLRS
jgi:hypothetical protein